MTVPTTEQLKEKLADAVSKTIRAGHIRPGWNHSGTIDERLGSRCGDYLADYWRESQIPSFICFLRCHTYLQIFKRALKSISKANYKTTHRGILLISGGVLERAATFSIFRLKKRKLYEAGAPEPMVNSILFASTPSGNTASIYPVLLPDPV